MGRLCSNVCHSVAYLLDPSSGEKELLNPKRYKEIKQSSYQLRYDNRWIAMGKDPQKARENRKIHVANKRLELYLCMRDKSQETVRSTRYLSS